MEKYNIVEWRRLQVHKDKGKEEIGNGSFTVEKYWWLILIPVCAIFCFISWEIGQGLGVDLGRFIYNLKY